MKKSRKLLSALLCAAMTASMLSACGSGAGTAATTAAAGTAAAGAADTAAASTAAAGTEAAKTASADGAISVCDGSEDAMVLNTAKSGTLGGLSACRHLFEGLYKLDEKGEVVPGQAKDVKVSDDGLTYTFTLRDDITWSDGQPVKAADFVYGWKYLKDSAADYSTLLEMVADAQATDDKTLTVKLSYACSYLPAILAFPSTYPVRQDYAEKYGDAYATDPDKAVYNGPYKLTDWSHQQSMTLTKRDDYYDAAKITAPEIDWLLMTDTSTMLASYQSGDIVYSDTYPEEAAASLENNGLHFTSGYNTYCAMFNLGDSGNAVLKDAKVRRALSLAVDRDRLMSIRNLHDELATSYTPSGLKNAAGTEFNSTVTPWYGTDYKANCEEAKKLLAEAGYENGANFPALRYIVNNDSRKEIAEAVVSDWKDVLGISTVTVESVENFFAARQDGDYDISYYGWYMDYVDISNILSTMKTGNNDAKYANADYDKAFDTAIAETDETKQWADYDKCEELLAADAPIAPFFHSDNSYLFDDTKYDGLVYYCGNVFFGYVHTK